LPGLTMQTDQAIQERLELAKQRWSTAESPGKRGKAFEELVRAVFEAIPGMEVQATERRPVGDEVDLVVWNEGTDPVGQDLDRVILIECKNRREPVGADSVRELLQRITSRGLHSGVLVTSSRFSKEAQEEARRSLSRDQVRLLLLDGKALEKVASAEDARGVLKQRYAALLLP